MGGFWQCSRVNCPRHATYRMPTDPKGKPLCARHFTAKYGMSAAKARQMVKEGLDPMTQAGINMETVAVAPDGRGYNLKSVGAGHLLRNLNIDDASVALALNMTPADVFSKRIKIIRETYADATKPSKEHLLQVLADLIGE